MYLRASKSTPGSRHVAKGTRSRPVALLPRLHRAIRCDRTAFTFYWGTCPCGWRGATTALHKRDNVLASQVGLFAVLPVVNDA